VSFFDRANTTYVDATLGWQFPTWDSLKALFSTPPAQFPADFGESRVGESAAPAMTRIAGELSTNFARDNGEKASQLYRPGRRSRSLTWLAGLDGGWPRPPS